MTSSSDLYICIYKSAFSSPYNYDDEVQQIPAVPQVGVWVEEQAVGYYLQERLHCKNNEEQILHALLQRHKHKTVPLSARILHKM